MNAQAKAITASIGAAQQGERMVGLSLGLVLVLVLLIISTSGAALAPAS